MNLNKIPLKNKRIASRSIEEGEVLIFLDDPSTCLIEGANSIVWKMIDNKRSINRIISKISKDYENKNKIKTYVLEAINDLKKIRAIKLK